MSIIVREESTLSRRVVYLWCVGSDGTTPATGEAGGQPTFSVGGINNGSTDSTLRAWNASAGEYFVVLTQSEVSVLGPGVVRYSSANAIETSTPFMVIAVNSFDSVNAGLDNLDDTITSRLAPTTAGRTLDVTAGGTAGIDWANVEAQATEVDLSLTTIRGIDLNNDKTGYAIDTNNDKTGYTIAPGTYSDVTFSADHVEDVLNPVTAGTVTDKTGYTIAAGAYSNVTFSTGGQASSSVTLAPGTHSDATIQDVSNPLTIDTNNDKTGYTIAPGTYSTVTFSADHVEDVLNPVTAGTVTDKTGYTLTAADHSAIAEASADSVWDEARSGHVAAGSFGQFVISDAGSGLSSAASVLLRPGTHSNATVQDVVNPLTVDTVTDKSDYTLHPDQSIATIGRVDNVTALDAAIIGSAQFAAGAIDAAALATDAGQEIADRVLARNIAQGGDGTRTVEEALAALRNRVQLSTVSLIVYDTNDTTILWHGSRTTTDSAVFNTDINPA